MPASVAIDFANPIPLFPLASCVLLPHASTPLHVFEERYRAMVRDALDSRRLIAMATFEGDDWQADYEGAPPLRENVCIGYIVRHQELPDGRFNVLLQGICRARIADEIEHEPYRVAHMLPVEDPSIMELDLEAQRKRLESLIRDPKLCEIAGVGAICHWINDEVPTAALVDLATLALCHNTEDRYQMLADPDPAHRAAWLETYLRDTRRTVEMADAFGASTDKDGNQLN